MPAPRPALSRLRRRARHTLSGLLGLGVVAALAVPGLAPARAAAAVDCTQLAAPVLQRIKPSSGTSLLTLFANEAAGARRNGFTQDGGTAFRASSRAVPGLVGLRRMYSPRTGDFLYTSDGAEAARLVAANSYVDQGARFYVSPSPGNCLVGVQRYVRGTAHRLVLAGQGNALAAAGWRNEGTKFYARPAAAAGQTMATRPIATTTGTRFSFAVVPDTQMEVVKAGDPRMANRAAWVLKQPKMSFLLQTGDLVNWDTPDHAQYRAAKRGLAAIERARLPYTVAVGNHDSQATGVGGSARDPARSHLLARETSTLNSYFDAADFRGVGGAYERGTIDNVYTLYTAGGLKWMVLSLEFCPRASVVAWARRVVAAHRDYNVIVNTHYYLTSSGRIGTTNQGYGDTSPQYLWKNLVSQYPNIKLVYSGHVGKATRARADKGVKGNRVYSFLTTMHDRRTNPTRIVTVDTKARTLTTKVYAPYTKTTWKAYTQTIKGLTFVR